MTTLNLLRQIADAGTRLELVGDALRISGHRPSSDVLDEIRARKADLLTWLRLEAGEVWRCASCKLTRSTDETPCPGCGASSGWWFMPGEEATR